MNAKQRIALVASLVITGFILFHAMAIVDNETRSLVFNTLILSWGNGIGKRNLYIAHGTTGIFLGLITPLSLWATAAYIALGSKKIGANS